MIAIFYGLYFKMSEFIYSLVFMETDVIEYRLSVDTRFKSVTLLFTDFTFVDSLRIILDRKTRYSAMQCKMSYWTAMAGIYRITTYLQITQRCRNLCFIYAFLTFNMGHPIYLVINALFCYDFSMICVFIILICPFRLLQVRNVSIY